MIDIAKAASRPLGVAHAAGATISESELLAKQVVLTGEADVLASENGRNCFLDSLRLMIRLIGKLTIVLPEGADSLRIEVERICGGAAFASCSIVEGDALGHVTEVAAILSVGVTGHRDLPWTTINSNGWVARVDSCGRSLPDDVAVPNPMAALMAASLGVAEVFKRLIGIPHEIAPPVENAAFSLFELDAEPLSLGPDLPSHIDLTETLLVGAGALGNGIALLLSQLPMSGRLRIVDKQDYADENYGTCVLLEPTGWVGAPKAIRLAEWLAANSRLSASGEKRPIREAIQASSTPIPTVVLGALDDVRARHDMQLAWPDILVDGGISDVGAGVVQHRWNERGLACLRCAFEVAGADHRATQRKISGLTDAALDEPDRKLSEEDVRQADPEAQAWLMEKLQEGKTICSVVSEAGLRKLGVAGAQGFRPSVPFVATASAALVVAELVKALVWPDVKYSQTFQMGSLFLGPDSGVRVDKPAKPACECTAHRQLIAKVRSRRVAPQDG